MSFAGVGISYRCEFEPFASALSRTVDCVEVLFEEVFHPGVEGTEVLDWNVPKAAHALTFSPARADFCIDPAADRQFAAAHEHGVALISDHLSFSQVGEYGVPNFFPCNLRIDEAERIANNVRRLAERAGMPVAIENPVTFLSHPDDEIPESEFINRVLTHADCGLLLDVNNLHINAVNHRYDPYTFLDRLNGDRVSYLHVAGHTSVGGLLMDSHDSAVSKPVWDLLEHAIKQTSATAVVLERDNRSASEEEIMSELHLLRDMWARHH